MLALGLVSLECPNSMATQHYSIVKHSFLMTKKESPNEDCIVVFLAERVVQIVDEVVTVNEEKDEGSTIWTKFSAKNTTLQSSFELSFLVERELSKVREDIKI